MFSNPVFQNIEKCEDIGMFQVKSFICRIPTGVIHVAPNVTNRICLPG